MGDVDQRTKEIAMRIALWHGQKMIYVDRASQMQTVASSRGFGHWGDSSEKYMHVHWFEYTSAAEQILLEITQRATDAYAKGFHEGKNTGWNAAIKTAAYCAWRTCRNDIYVKQAGIEKICAAAIRKLTQR